MRPSLVRGLVAIFTFTALACSSSAGPGPSPSEGAEPGPAAPVATTPPGGSAPPAAQAPPTSEEPSAKYEPLFVGRFDTTDPAGPRATWPGARILARFDGTAVSVKLSEFAEPWMEGAPSYWEVRVDKGAWTPITMIADNQPHDFELAKDLPPGPHEIELYKRSETQTGMTQFLGFDFHGGKGLAPPSRQLRKIEVMGDSQATGFGVEVTDAPETDCPGADHSGKYQNFRKAWGALLGERYDAEVHGIVYSGKGILRNVWPDDPDTLLRYYPRTNPNPALQNSNPQLFDLTSWIPDVVVLSHASIDFSGGVDPNAFRAAYRDFVINTLRARGPNTHIFLAVLGRGGRSQVPPMAEEIRAERAAVGDDKIHPFVANDYVWTEMLGCNGHGTPAWHQRIADELSAEIGKYVGWN